MDILSFKRLSSRGIQGFIRTGNENLYYFKYYAPTEDPKCPYCGGQRKCPRYTRAYITCGSIECKSEFSSLGAKNQIEYEGGLKAWHQRRVDRRNELYPTMCSEIMRKANYEMNKYRRETGFTTETEAILYERLKQEGLEFSYQDYRYFGGGTNDLNIIMDFTFYDKLNVELDGEYHKNRHELDETRDSKLRTLGWSVLRIESYRVYDDLDSVIDEIKQAITSTTISKESTE